MPGKKRRLKGVSAMSIRPSTLECLGGMFRCSKAVSGIFVLFSLRTIYLVVLFIYPDVFKLKILINELQNIFFKHIECF